MRLGDARLSMAAAAALTLVAVLSGCGDGSPPSPTTPSPMAEPTPTPVPSPAATPTPSPTPTPTGGPDSGGPDGTPAAIPDGFPDPETLLGKEAFEEQGAGGAWRTVVGGEPLELENIFSACFDGGTADICRYAISGAGPAGQNGVPADSDVALLLLLGSTGERADGSALWEVLDAILTRSPGAPGILQVCDGMDGVAFYPTKENVEPDAETIPAAAAWGADDGLTSLVELDPTAVTCAYVGE